MSYNVTAWHTKRIIDLKTPLNSFYVDEDWHPRRTNHDDGLIALSVSNSEVKGTLEASASGNPDE